MGEACLAENSIIPSVVIGHDMSLGTMKKVFLDITRTIEALNSNMICLRGQRGANLATSTRFFFLSQVLMVVWDIPSRDFAAFLPSRFHNSFRLVLMAL